MRAASLLYAPPKVYQASCLPRVCLARTPCLVFIYSVHSEPHMHALSHGRGDTTQLSSGEAAGSNYHRISGLLDHAYSWEYARNLTTEV